jgi:hypothetical protein
MKSAPAWITYVTAAVAIMAFLVSIATYLRAGPRIRVKTHISSWREKEPEITVTVINRGLAPVDLVSLAIGFRAILGLIYISELSDSVYRDGRTLHRLEPGSQRNWHYSLRELAEKVDAEMGAPRLNWFVTKLSSGRPRIKWQLLAVFIPVFGILNYLMSGLVISADLGNGVQKSSLPSQVLMIRLFSYVATLENSRREGLQTNGSSNPNGAGI